MSTDIKRVGDSGIHTVEGNVAGARAAELNKQREKQRLEYEALKDQIKRSNAAEVGNIGAKFSSASNEAENEFRRRTVGLVTAEEFRKAREDGAKALEQQQLAANQELLRIGQETQANLARERQLRMKRAAASLSFSIEEEDDDDDDDEEVGGMRGAGTGKGGHGHSPPAKRMLKDPTVDTSFLPDANREKELQKRRDELKQEWLAQQEGIKKERLEVTYSYWDGSGHRKVLETAKGTTVGRFVELVKAQLMGEFPELRSVNADDLLYVKEDLIIPHHLSFYDLIITKARGKSGPLFHFDVHDDVRLVNDARVEKDESHPGKVVERRWYERNKHIFPASRWEIFDPSKSREHIAYTIHGGEVAKKS